MHRILVVLSVFGLLATGACALDKSLRPEVRPAGLPGAPGQVCGSTQIIGEPLATIPGRIPQCAVVNPVRVHAVSGVPLSQPATLTCDTAQTLQTWVDAGMKPAVGGYRDGVSQINVAGHYACRTRNNQPGAKVSEHGKGRAIDISGFQMGDGSTITLLQDWGKGKPGRILKNMWTAACGPFGTVLGPESNEFHRDHFHFDTAQYRSGSYCR